MSVFSAHARRQVEVVLRRLGYTYLGCGRHRAAYRRGNYVVKVPLSEEGLWDNWKERQTWLHHHQNGYIKYARCRLLYNSLLVMEYAHFPGLLSNKDGYIPYDCMPGWGMAVDCGQIGYNSRGKLVAFDYA